MSESNDKHPEAAGLPDAPHECLQHASYCIAVTGEGAYAEVVHGGWQAMLAGFARAIWVDGDYSDHPDEWAEWMSMFGDRDEWLHDEANEPSSIRGDLGETAHLSIYRLSAAVPAAAPAAVPMSPTTPTPAASEREALSALVDVVEAAGLHNLVNGVQLGRVVWYVKASDAMNAARAALSAEPAPDRIVGRANSAEEAIRMLKAEPAPAEPRRYPNSVVPEGMTAWQYFQESWSIEDGMDPIERLRYFCSLSMNGQDWLDVEPLFDALTAALPPAPPQEPQAVAEHVGDAAFEGWLSAHERTPYRSGYSKQDMRCSYWAGFQQAAAQRSAPTSPTEPVARYVTLSISDEEIDLIANDGMRNAAGGIYATSVYKFAHAIERAVLARWHAEPAAARDSGAVPEGWELTRNGNFIIVAKPGLGRFAALKDDTSIASAILYELADALLAATPSHPAEGEAG